MGFLFLFAFISGFVTILAPCIWPILPIILSASATGGHRKPLGVTLGVILSFGFLTLSIAYIVKVIPFDTNALRLFAAAIIGILGLTLVIPKLSGILEGSVSRLSGRLNLNNVNSTGFWSGLVVGLALGVVWAPCAGPILATIAALAATQKVNLDVVLVTVSYVIGIAIPLFIFATLGRHLFTKSRVLSKYTGRIQQVFGVIMILTAVLIVFNIDKTIQAKLLDYIPSYGALLNKLEGNNVVTRGLDQLKGTESSQLGGNGLFNENKPAPDFVGITNWMNETPGSTNDKPVSIKDLKGKVVLVDFWTYTCINCIRTLPHVTSWYDKYHDKGFTVIGVHTPEFDFEKNTDNVASAIKQYKINYPVAQDNDYSTWNNYSNRFWPAEYLIDAKGNIRRVHFGEGKYDEMEEAIQKLLEEKGTKVDMALENMPDTAPQFTVSPETYLGAGRMAYLYPNRSVPAGLYTFKLDQDIPSNTFSYGGQWLIQDENAQSVNDSTLVYNFYADRVFLVMNGGKDKDGGVLTVTVLLDGQPLNSNNAGSDVITSDPKKSYIEVPTDKLYNLIDLHGNPGQHKLELRFSPSIKAFAFTFG